MKKRENWQSLLNKHLLSTMDRPFRYGRHDCCTAISRILKILTGEDVLKIFGKYTSEKQASEIKDLFGNVEGVAQRVADEYNLNTIPVNRVVGGDVVVAHAENGNTCLGIVALGGRGVYIASAPKGWAILPLTEVITAYRIP